jgi:hypothetical protein
MLFFIIIIIIITIISVDVQISFCIPRLILQALKLMTM